MQHPSSSCTLPGTAPTILSSPKGWFLLSNNFSHNEDKTLVSYLAFEEPCSWRWSQWSCHHSSCWGPPKRRARRGQVPPSYLLLSTQSETLNNVQVCPLGLNQSWPSVLQYRVHRIKSRICSGGRILIHFVHQFQFYPQPRWASSLLIIRTRKAKFESVKPGRQNGCCRAAACGGQRRQNAFQEWTLDRKKTEVGEQDHKQTKWLK